MFAKHYWEKFKDSLYSRRHPRRGMIYHKRKCAGASNGVLPVTAMIWATNFCLLLIFALRSEQIFVFCSLLRWGTKKIFVWCSLSRWGTKKFLFVSRFCVWASNKFLFAARFRVGQATVSRRLHLLLHCAAARVFQCRFYRHGNFVCQIHRNGISNHLVSVVNAVIDE